MKPVAQLLAAIALGACLFVPIQRFKGDIGDEQYKTTFAVASLAWFIFAPLSLRRNQ